MTAIERTENAVRFGPLKRMLKWLINLKSRVSIDDDDDAALLQKCEKYTKENKSHMHLP